MIIGIRSKEDSVTEIPLSQESVVVFVGLWSDRSKHRLTWANVVLILANATPELSHLRYLFWVQMNLICLLRSPYQYLQPVCCSTRPTGSLHDDFFAQTGNGSDK